MTDYKQMVTGF